MPNTKNPVLESVRIIPRDQTFLERKVGSRGEIFFDQSENTLRLFDGVVPGGISLLRADLENITAQISSVIVSETAPAGVDEGTIWFNSTNGRLYVYYNDGNTTQWVQPTSSSYGGSSGATTLNGLDDVTITSPATGQVLKYNGTAWVNGTDNTGGGGGGATILDELTDVVISSPTSDQVLKYNGSAWINSTLTSGVTSVTAGSGITVSASTGAITISSTLASPSFSTLTDATAASVTIDQIYMPAITMLNVTNTGTSAFLFDQYSGNNPIVYAIGGTTIAFKLNISGHPFLIQDGTGTNYNTGLVHVSTAGVVSQGSSAQGKTSGTLYWKVPASISGGYRYQCQDHAPMVGSILVKNIVGL